MPSCLFSSLSPHGVRPQVADLKTQLAKQEVELNHKNEQADKLIEIVGVETEKVSKEKAIADEEEKKVQTINLEVSAKQKGRKDRDRFQRGRFVVGRLGYGPMAKPN